MALGYFDDLANDGKPASGPVSRAGATGSWESPRTGPSVLPSGEVDISDATRASLGAGRGNVMGAINNFFRPDSPSAQSYRENVGLPSVAGNAPIETGSAPGVRIALSPPAHRGTGDSAPTVAPYAPPPETDPLPSDGPLSRAAVSLPDSGVAADPSKLDRIKSEYAAGQMQDRLAEAQRAQATQDGDIARMGATRSIQAGLDATRLRRESDIASFLAKNGVHGGPTIRGVNQQQQAATLAATQANARADTAEAAARAPVDMPRRNYIDDFARGQNAVSAAGEIANRTALTQQQLDTGAIDQAGKRIAVAGAQLDLQGKQRLNELGTALTTATDPKQIARLHSQMLALLGKDKPEEYTVTHAPGASRVDPQTYAVVKDPDTLYITNRRTGVTEQIGGAKQGPVPPQGAIALLAKDPSPRNKALFEQIYGAGSAATYLAK